ncbi:MAG: hypothetical protein Q8L68_01630 [Methylococcales bacterium]|nr:hypothetical protein [Methylococcales bacterium]
MNLSESDVCRTIVHINNSFQDFSKNFPLECAFKAIQQSSWYQLQGLAILFCREPEILVLIKSTQEEIKSFQPDGVGRSSAQPFGDVEQGGNS